MGAAFYTGGVAPFLLLSIREIREIRGLIPLVAALPRRGHPWFGFSFCQKNGVINIFLTPSF